MSEEHWTHPGDDVIGAAYICFSYRIASIRTIPGGSMRRAGLFFRPAHRLSPVVTASLAHGFAHPNRFRLA
jgi:hypothetical protein